MPFAVLVRPRIFRAKSQTSYNKIASLIKVTQNAKPANCGTGSRCPRSLTVYRNRSVPFQKAFRHRQQRARPAQSPSQRTASVHVAFREIRSEKSHRSD